MEDQICSSEKHSKKNFYNKNIYYLMKKCVNDKNVSNWIQIIYFDLIKIYFDIMKKVEVMKIYFI